MSAFNKAHDNEQINDLVFVFFIERYPVFNGYHEYKRFYMSIHG